MIRQCSLAAAMIGALSPVISHASTERISVKACASAFAASIAAPGAAAPAFKLAYRSAAAGSLADYYPANYSFTLEALDPTTGSAIARASCSTDARGAVTAIAAIPLDTRPAALATAY